MASSKYAKLAETCFTFPAIDNHAHNICQPEVPAAALPPFASIFSEATGEALTHARTSLAGIRALNELAVFYGCAQTWDALEAYIEANADEKRIAKCLTSAGIQGLLLDDLLPGVGALSFDYRDHDQFTSSPTKRIVRIESIAEAAVLKAIYDDPGVQHEMETENRMQGPIESFKDHPVCQHFVVAIRAALADPDVVGFKSVACYRTGLDVIPHTTWSKPVGIYLDNLAGYTIASQLQTFRLEYKPLNDLFLLAALEEIVLSPRANGLILPVQFHTGLGDSDLSLIRASPAHLQPLIKSFPTVPIVLLHSSYPYTRDAGYLAAVYENVWLDFGEIFPMLARHGQEAVVRQMLEICPASKLLWSTDGHWYPETFLLGSTQSRRVLYTVLADLVGRGDLSELQASQLVENALFHNSNKLYGLGWTPKPTGLKAPAL